MIYTTRKMNHAQNIVTENVQIMTKKFITTVYRQCISMTFILYWQMKHLQFITVAMSVCSWLQYSNYCWAVLAMINCNVLYMGEWYITWTTKHLYTSHCYTGWNNINVKADMEDRIKMNFNPVQITLTDSSLKWNKNSNI